MIKLSVIIPAYNCEKYIGRCIESILEQNYNSLEIICINDGSEDKTLNILNNYANKYNNIKLINKKNAGVSKARNDGIKEACGKYIMFVDADDVIKKDSLNNIDSILEKNYDLIRYNYEIDFGNNKKVIQLYPKSQEMSKEDFIDKIVNTGYMNSVWTTLYNKEFLEKYNIKFDSDYIMGEDLVFNIEVYTNLNKGYYYNKTIYKYIENQNSVSYNYELEKVKRKIENTNKVYKLLIEKLKKENITDKQEEKLYFKLFSMLEWEIKNIVYVKGINLKTKINYIKKYSIFLECNKNIKTNFKIKLLKNKLYLVYILLYTLKNKRC